MSAKAIARDLNRRGIPSPNNRQWTHSVVASILSHPRYVGCNVFNQTTKRLGGPWVARPRVEWLILPGAFKGIVDPNIFDLAQKMISNRTARKTDEQVLGELRCLLDSKGKLNPKIIDNAQGMACTRTLCRRFGSLRKAYELIGYK
jgi:Recombinase